MNSFKKNVYKSFFPLRSWQGCVTGNLSTIYHLYVYKKLLIQLFIEMHINIFFHFNILLNVTFDWNLKERQNIFRSFGKNVSLQQCLIRNMGLLNIYTNKAAFSQQLIKINTCFLK